MSDTPRTEGYVLNPLPEIVPADWARDLERELAAAEEHIRRLEEAGDEMAWYLGEQNYFVSEWRKAKEAKP